MTRWTQLSGATAMALVIPFSSAVADVTGPEVWEDWQTYMSDFGYKIDATESVSGDTLNISDIEIVWPIPNDEGTISIDMPSLSFTDQANGSVLVGLPDVSTMTMNAESVDGEEINATVQIDLSDMTTIVSGDSDSLAYTSSADSLKIALVELMVDGDAPDELTVEMEFNNIETQSSMEIGDIRDITQVFTAETVTYDIRVVDNDEDANFIGTGAVNGLAFEGTAAVPSDYDVNDPSALFKAGFAFDGTFRQSSSEMQVQGSDEGKPFSFESTAGSGEVDIAMSDEGINYAGGGRDLTFSVAGADIPLPVSFEMAEVGYNFKMPWTASEKEQPFALGLTLGGINVPDLLWNMLDPAAVLPREPATISLDLAGAMRLFKDLTDPTLEDSDEFPGELVSLSLEDLVVEIAGAELTGKGDFVFDNTDTESFDGLPRPEGAANFRLLGGNGLLDKLIQMGIVQEGDAMGARMMMGLFAVPGPAEDELNSRIEINEKGHISANGQRIK